MSDSKSAQDIKVLDYYEIFVWWFVLPPDSDEQRQIYETKKESIGVVPNAATGHTIDCGGTSQAKHVFLLFFVLCFGDGSEALVQVKDLCRRPPIQSANDDMPDATHTPTVTKLPDFKIEYQ